MKRKDIEDLGKKPIALLRVSRDAWNAIADTHRQGVRFSLHFPHETARAGQRGGLVLIATTGSDPALRLGLITSIAATSTFDSRVVFDLVSFAAPGALARLLQSVSDLVCGCRAIGWRVGRCNSNASRRARRRAHLGGC